MAEEKQKPEAGPIPAEAAAQFEQVETETEGAPGEVKNYDQPGEGQEPPGPPTSELLRPVVELVHVSLAPAWAILPEQKDAISQAYADVLDKYFPGGLGNFGPELTALMVTAAVVLPNMGQPRYQEPPEEKPEENQEAV